MKYFKELSETQKEKAIDKMLRYKHKGDGLLRVHFNGLNGSVLSIYWLNNEIVADIIRDRQYQIIKKIPLLLLKPAIEKTVSEEHMKMVREFTREMLTNDSELYMFDERMNCVPVNIGEENE